MIEGPVHQGNLTTVPNIYAPNKGLPKHMRQKMIELQAEIKKSTITGERF